MLQCRGMPAVPSGSSLRAENDKLAGIVTATPDAAFLSRWVPAPGIVFLGPVEGSGLKDNSYLLQRGDGQIVQLSELLHLVMISLSVEKSLDDTARDISDAYGRELGVSGLRHLIDTRLAPMGLVRDGSAVPAEAPAAPRADPLLVLRLKGTLLPEKAVNGVAAILAPLYWGPVVVTVLAAVVLIDALVIARSDFMASLEQILLTPALLLGIFALLTLAAVIHELGHATACRYGGARPGVIGVGVSLVFQGFFLLAAGLMHFQMIQQLVPTLRFDGYFVLADIAGVPDLFNRIRPVLLSLIPGRPVDPLVTQLRPFARRIVTVWVVTVVPLLVLSLGWMLVSLPAIIEQAATAIRRHAGLAAAAVEARDLPSAALSMLSILMLSLPIVGLAILLYRLLSGLLALFRRLGRRLFRHPLRSTAEPEAVAPRHLRAVQPGAGKPLQMGKPLQKGRSAMAIAVPPAAVPDNNVPAAPLRSPSHFHAPAPAEVSGPLPGSLPGPVVWPQTDDDVPTLQDFLADRPVPPSALAEGGWQGVIRRLTGNSISPAPGRRELAHLQAVEDVQRRLDGPRTVVVGNPKGGAHKTTATLLLAATLGIQRGGYTLAWDNNETRGTLGWRAPMAGHTATAVDLLQEVDRFEDPALGRIGDLDRFVRYQGSAQFDVLASDEDAAGAATIGGREFDRLHSALRRFYRIIMVDTGNNMRSSNWEAAVAAADELVIVSTLREDTVASAVWLVDGLRERGYQDKVRNAVTLLAAPSRHTDVQLHQRTRAHFESLTREVLDVPYDSSLVAGGPLSYQALQPETREAWLRASAAVMQGL